MAITNEQRITNLLSMAQRANRIVSGAFVVEQAMKKKQAVFVLLAGDAAEESKKNFKNLINKRFPMPRRLTVRAWALVWARNFVPSPL